ncbi:MAG: universal stress protein [Saprospiraceae bacterium]
MIDLSPLPAASTQTECGGGCPGCGKVHLKLFGAHDAASRQLYEHVSRALAVFPMSSKVIEVTDPTAIAASGVGALPALSLDGQVLVEGRVPGVDELIELFQNRHLFQSKLYRLHKILVAVDISMGSDSALRYAWHIAQKTNAQLEVVYAIDTIFVGHTSSASGFLSGYQHTMQLELDAFIRETLAGMGVQYEPSRPGAPAQPLPSPYCSSRVLYGIPETALEECSLSADLLVVGTTGQGTLGKKIFGSVSMEISKRAHCPVLLVPPDAEFRGLPDMVYASNFESLSRLHIQQAIAFARHFEGQIHFVHVGPGPEEGMGLERKLFEANYRESHAEQPFLYRKMVTENVMAGLYDYATFHRVDLLVFVTHQRGFWENILHRSITRAAAVSSDLPILIIHSDDDMLP